jgi:hypothetical protein
MARRGHSKWEVAISTSVSQVGLTDTGVGHAQVGHCGEGARDPLEGLLKELEELHHCEDPNGGVGEQGGGRNPRGIIMRLVFC